MMSTTTIYSLLIVSLLLGTIWSAELHNREVEVFNGTSKSNFLDKLLKSYDHRIRPNFNKDKPVVIECNIFVSSFDSVSETTMDYSVDIYLRQMWHDPRLEMRSMYNKSITLSDDVAMSRIWVPDLFFSNEKGGYFHTITVPNRYIRISPDGKILYSTRLTLRLSCPMQLEKFPLDKQVCKMMLESYGHTTDDVVFAWSPENPIQTDPMIEIPQFELIRSTVADCTKTYITGTFTCLQVRFELHRQFGYYLIQVFVPSVLIVALSWVSFWIDPASTPARISLGILTVLTMTTQASGARATLPRVSYIKAIDVWMTTCLIFVFGSLVEFAVVNVLSRGDEMFNLKKHFSRRKPEKSAKRNDNDVPIAVDSDRKVEETLLSPSNNDNENVLRLNNNRAAFADTASKIFFPVAFILFNVIFWPAYIYSEDKM